MAAERRRLSSFLVILLSRLVTRRSTPGGGSHWPKRQNVKQLGDDITDSNHQYTHLPWMVRQNWLRLTLTHWINPLARNSKTKYSLSIERIQIPQSSYPQCNSSVRINKNRQLIELLLRIQITAQLAVLVHESGPNSLLQQELNKLLIIPFNPPKNWS